MKISAELELRIECCKITKTLTGRETRVISQLVSRVLILVLDYSHLLPLMYTTYTSLVSTLVTVTRVHY